MFSFYPFLLRLQHLTVFNVFACSFLEMSRIRTKSNLRALRVTRFIYGNETSSLKVEYEVLIYS